MSTVYYAHYKDDGAGGVDFVHHGENPNGCACDIVFEYATKRELILAHPRVAEIEKQKQLRRQREQYNETHPTHIVEKHAFKYVEALLYHNGVITDLEKLAHLKQEATGLADLYYDGDLLEAAADLAVQVIGKASADAHIEKKRICGRALYR